MRDVQGVSGGQLFISLKFHFTLLFVAWLNLNFQVAVLSSEAGFKSINNKGVVMETWAHNLPNLHLYGRATVARSPTLSLFVTKGSGSNHPS